MKTLNSYLQPAKKPENKDINDLKFLKHEQEKNNCLS